MTLSERRNYRIAVAGSILFHGILLFCLSYGSLSGVNGTDLEIHSASLVAIAQESSPRPVARTRAVKPQAAANRRIETAPEPVRAKPAPKPEPPKPPKPATPKPTAEPNPESAPSPKKMPTVQEDQSEVGGSTSSNVSSESSRSLGDGSGLVGRRGVIRSNNPTYPKAAENVGIEGNVTLRITVLPDGSHGGIEVLDSSGDDRLNRAAINFVQREWTFKPNPERYTIDVVFSFKIHEPVSHRFLNAQTRP